MAKKAKAQTEVQAKPLTGKALLQKLKELPHLSRREKAHECGYLRSCTILNRPENQSSHNEKSKLSDSIDGLKLGSWHWCKISVITAS